MTMTSSFQKKWLYKNSALPVKKTRATRVVQRARAYSSGSTHTFAPSYSQEHRLRSVNRGDDRHQCTRCQGSRTAATHTFSLGFDGGSYILVPVVAIFVRAPATLASVNVGIARLALAWADTGGRGAVVRARGHVLRALLCDTFSKLCCWCTLALILAVSAGRQRSGQSSEDHKCAQRSHLFRVWRVSHASHCRTFGVGTYPTRYPTVSTRTPS